MSNSSTSNPASITPFVKSQVAELFSKHSVVLVHCVSDIKGVGNTQTNKLTPIGRLINAIAHRCDVSASTIQKGDTSSRRRYYGPLGLILDPVVFASISLGWPGDAGSSIDSDTGERDGKGKGMNSPDDVSSAIKQRGICGDLYNEICSSKWKIVGLFADTDHPTFQRPTPLPPQEPDDSEWIAEGGVQGQSVLERDRFTYDINTIGQKFPDLPLFFWQPASGTFEVRIFDRDSGTYKIKDGEPVDISKVYDCPDRY